MMSRFVKDTSSCGGEGSAKGSSASEGPSQPSNHLDHEIAHLTKLGSEPHKLLTRTAPGRSKLPISTVKMLVARETNHSGRGRFSSADGCHVLSRYLPTTGPCRVDQMNSRAYTSQFSADGSLFVAGFQGSHIRIYNVNKGWKVQKDILAKSLRWTITDTSLSPDQQYLVYASMSPMVHIVNVGSAATESVANITSDVNTVCFADETGHLLYSGSDDNLCKVWDRRCFITKGQAAGVLMGHLQGITFLDSRGDGRYLISNGKDQTTKLWDIRKMSSTVIYPKTRDADWDYRWMEYPQKARKLRHPRDQSLATYRGHSVLRTLIRCYFSPTYSTGQKYIYTGSSDSSVYIYDLVSGAQVARLDYHDAPVRDCNWHPVYPMIISSSWDGDIVKWEFPGSDESPPIKRRKRRRKNY
ncbi:LEC14B homolog isoform X2 [Quercus lobata]|uniref:LEC14B homolog isoform X2 n=1 Tax=Quercus lobata TaxID=97700 RepID=UPI001245D550|nr:LEC14B homolog isoform X2 [Quercus lobata]